VRPRVVDAREERRREQPRHLETVQGRGAAEGVERGHAAVRAPSAPEGAASSPAPQEAAPPNPEDATAASYPEAGPLGSLCPGGKRVSGGEGNAS
jgi:hypothetical protein